MLNRPTIKPKLDQWMDWSNFQAETPQPITFRMKYVLPVWLADHGGQWGFFPLSRGADIGEYGSDKATLRKAFDFAVTASGPTAIPTVVDLEKYWPGGSDWGYTGSGPVTREKLLTCAIMAGRSTQLLNAVHESRPTSELPIGAYLPGNFWDNAGPNFVKLFVEGYAKLFIDKLDFILLDVYAHPSDQTPVKYFERIRANIQAYKTLGKPIVLIVKYSADGAKSDPLGFLKAAKRAAEVEKIKAIAFWDELNLSWTPEIGRAYESIR